MIAELTDLGFTGTREPLTDWQLMMLAAQLDYHRQLGFSVLHMGDCVGADAVAARMARHLGYTIHSHPPDNDRLRAFFPSDREEKPLPYLHRNDVIVLHSQAGLAVPNTATPVRGSGTWHTIGRFKAAHRPFWVIAPATTWAVVGDGVAA